MDHLAENLWHLQFPLKLLGANMQRHVTVIRLGTGEVVVHSTAPFTKRDVDDISALGKVGWVMDTMLRHETFAKDGHAAFPAAAFLGPAGFSEAAGFPVQGLLPAPAAWGDELQVIRLDGLPSMEEHVVFHAPSRTLIVADLFFDHDPAESWWTNLLLSLVAGRKDGPGVSRAVRLAVKDKAAFKRSLDAVRAWDFDRIIVGHGGIVPTGGKARFDEALHRAGY